MHDKPTEKQIVALARLQNNTDFKMIVDWYESMLAKQDIQNRTLTDHRLPQGQGSAQTLAHILEYNNEAKNLAKKLR